MRFTDEELRNPIFMEVTTYPDGPNEGLIEFRGFIKRDTIINLNLDHIDRQIIGSEARSMADCLQSFEILFRRYEQKMLR
jgi:hypothetical protein